MHKTQQGGLLQGDHQPSKRDFHTRCTRAQPPTATGRHATLKAQVAVDIKTKAPQQIFDAALNLVDNVLLESGDQPGMPSQAALLRRVNRVKAKLRFAEARDLHFDLADNYIDPRELLHGDLEVRLGREQKRARHQLFATTCCKSGQTHGDDTWMGPSRSCGSLSNRGLTPRLDMGDAGHHREHHDECCGYQMAEPRQGMTTTLWPPCIVYVTCCLDHLSKLSKCFQHAKINLLQIHDRVQTTVAMVEKMSEGIRAGSEHSRQVLLLTEATMTEFNPNMRLLVIPVDPDSERSFSTLKRPGSFISELQEDGDSKASIADFSHDSVEPVEEAGDQPGIPSKAALLRRVSRVKAKTRPADPRDLEFDLANDYVPENFLIGDLEVCLGREQKRERQLVFATPYRLKKLADARRWYMDGTFKCGNPSTHPPSTPFCNDMATTSSRCAWRTNVGRSCAHRTTLYFNLEKQHLSDGFFKADIRFDGHRHLVFATDQQPKLLSRAKTWYMDETFKVVGRPFYQLFGNHAFVREDENEKQVPLALVFMSNKDKKDYKKKGMWQAVRSVFPGKTRIGCAFHWTQAVYCKIQELGLQQAYRRREGAHRLLRNFLGLLMLKHVRPTFEALCEEAAYANDARPDRLTTYIRTYWMESTVWQVSEWVVFMEPSYRHGKIIRGRNIQDEDETSIRRKLSRECLEYINGGWKSSRVVQVEVKKPGLYIIEKFGGSDQEQPLFAETRRGDGRDIRDGVLRFFKGDQPPRQFEFGQQ
uniref:MULE transposase domain-containing protein n=1 Tax=Branchiostoma floridae TaxID=7739 RepID=C3YHF8_BRAFL|eukprot:XP_002604383.1 hypothetical protein BRAFLDRAFT_73369 [Branchiostoma floridae]